MQLKSWVCGLMMWSAPVAAMAASAGVVAECKLLESAYLTTQKAGLQARPDILVGCPGYDNFQETMTNLSYHDKLFNCPPMFYYPPSSLK